MKKAVFQSWQVSANSFLSCSGENRFVFSQNMLIVPSYYVHNIMWVHVDIEANFYYFPCCIKILSKSQTSVEAHLKACFYFEYIVNAGLSTFAFCLTFIVFIQLLRFKILILFFDLLYILPGVVSDQEHTRLQSTWDNEFFWAYQQFWAKNVYVPPSILESWSSTVQLFYLPGCAIS